MKKLLLTALLAGSLSVPGMAIEIDNVRVSTRQLGASMNAPEKVAASTTTADVLVNENFEAWNLGTNENPDFDNQLASLNGEVEIDPDFTHGSQWYGHKVYMAGGAAAMRTLSMDQAILNTPRMDYSGSIKLTFVTRALMSEWEDEDGKMNQDNSAHLLVGLSEEKGRPFETNAKGTLVDLQLYADMGWMEVTVEFDNYSAYSGSSFVFAATNTLLVDDIRITSSSDEFIAAPVLKEVTNVTDDSFTISWEKVRKSYNYYIWLYTYEGTDPETGEDMYEIVFPKEILDALKANDMTVEDYIEEMGGPESVHIKYDVVHRSSPLSYTFKGLDPTKEYAYAVMSHNVFQFSDKKLQRMTIVPTPKVYEASNITDNSFTANWSKLTKAASYDVDLYGVTVMSEDDQEYTLFHEGFDKTSDYSKATDIENATPCTTDMTMSDVTDDAGWLISSPLALEMPGLPDMPVGYMLDGWFGFGMNQTIATPNVYIGNNDFVYLTMKLKCANPDAPIVMQFAGSMYMANMNGQTEATADLELPTNGLTESRLELACMDQQGSTLFLDDIVISQPVKLGDRIFKLLSTTNVPAEQTSLVYNDVDKLGYNIFAYALTTITEDGRKSATSERQIVKFKPESSVEEITAGMTDAVEVARYSIDGRLLQAPTPGINIVRYSDGSSKKVLVK